MRKCIANENTARLTKYQVGEEVTESAAVCEVLVRLGNAQWSDDAPQDAKKRRAGRTEAAKQNG